MPHGRLSDLAIIAEQDFQSCHPANSVRSTGAVCITTRASIACQLAVSTGQAGSQRENNRRMDRRNLRFWEKEDKCGPHVARSPKGCWRIEHGICSIEGREACHAIGGSGLWTIEDRQTDTVLESRPLLLVLQKGGKRLREPLEQGASVWLSALPEQRGHHASSPRSRLRFRSCACLRVGSAAKVPF